MAIDLGLGDKLALLAQGLDQLDIGFTVFDRDLVMVAANRRFQALLNFPDALCQPGCLPSRINDMVNIWLHSNEADFLIRRSRLAR